MNTDVRLYTGFWQHPKTKKMVKRLGLEAARSLQILWLFTAQNKSDGLLSGMDWEDIELAADWQGEEHAFFDYCLGVWIDETDQGYAIHDWEEHNPWQAEAAARSEQARQNAKAGWEKRRAKQSHANGNAENMQPQCDGNAAAKQSHANGNAPFLTSPVNIKTPLPPLQGGECDMHASGEAAPAEEPGKLPERDPGDEPRLVAKSGRVLAGKQLEDFERFWLDFGLSRGKAEAADAWLDIPDMTNALVARICEAARQEAADRPRLEDRRQKPKQARGWLLSRRWEDYEAPKARAPTPPDNFPTEVDRAVWEKAQVTRKRLEAEKQARRTGKAANGDET